jgi:GT2 family glycosyltransferase
VSETREDNPAVDLTISIATWDNRDLVAGCLRSIEPQRVDAAVEVFVVDNASTDGTADMIRREFPWAQLIRNERSQGFSANHNQVLRRAAGRFVLLLNDDTVVEEGALAHATRFMGANDDVGAVGCTLVKPDGVPEHISQRFPHPLDPILPGLRRKVNPRTEGRHGTEAVEVDRLSGACLVVRREVLERIGLLDERFDPAYGEDTDLCLRIKQAGWRIYRLPDARVVH